MKTLGLLACIALLALASWAPAQSDRAVVDVDSSFDVAKRVQGRGTTPAIAERDGRMMLQMNVAPSNEKWPGMYIKPEGGKWDLSGCNRMEFMLTNTGQVPVKASCRVDDDPKADGNKHCNTEGTTLKPGETKTVRIVFGRSYGGNPGWALNPANVVGILVFVDKPSGDAQVTIQSIRAAGGDMPGQLRITAGDQWKVIEHHLLPDKGSALDFSFINDAPAGKHGEVVIRDGHFEFRDKPGQRARFYGTNVVYGANFLSHAQAEAMAEQLARIGYNSLRFHHFDQILLDKTAGNSVTFSPEKLDQLDFFFAECKKRGIYITIDLYATRETVSGEIPEIPGKVTGQVYKGAVQVLDSARKNWEQFTTNLLNHVNPYTQMAWKDDPTLYLICLLNEGNAYQTWNAKAELKAAYQARFEQWLAKQPTQPQSAEEGQVAFNHFMTELQREWFAHGTKFLRDLGYKSLITDTNYISMRTHAIMRDDLDVVDIHAYFAPGSFTGEWGNSPLKVSPQDQVKAGADMPLKAFVSRLYGKPFAMTELNTSYPNEYRASSGAVFGGYGAFNDADALYRFDYIGSPQDTPRPIIWFSTANDPIQLLGERLGILMFTRGDLRPAQVQVPYLVTEEYLNNPKALDWSHWYPDPFSFTGIHSQIGTIVLRKGQTLKTSFKFAVTTEKVDEARLNGVKLVTPEVGANPAKLREMGLLPAADPANPVQLELDRKNGTMTVITDRSECLVLGAGRDKLEGKLLRVSDADMHATIGMAAIDDQPLATSKRVLILHLTNVANSNLLYRDETKQVIEKSGELPLLVQKGSARLTLSGDFAGAKLYAIDLSGKRVGEVALEPAGGGVSFVANTHRGTGPCLAYELVR